MRDPLAAVTTIVTSQTKPMRGRAQVRNAAGGYVFATDLWTKVEDFLILGTTGGTYYTAEDKLTTDNVDWLFAAITEDGPRLVELVSAIATSQPSRAPKPRPYLFALAAAAATGDAGTVQQVKRAFPKVVRTTDHLAMFFGYWKNLAGKPNLRGGTSPVIGRAMRTTFASFFDAEDVHDVAFRALKARQRATPSGEAMALRDIIRISHASGRTDAHRVLIGWLAGRVDDGFAREVVPDIDHFLTAQAVATPAEAVRVVRDLRVPWEFLPSDALKDATVWDELVGTIGLTALIRNLGRMTRIGTLAPFATANARVVDRLTNGKALIKARVHPMDLYLALKAYASGISRPGPRAKAQRWQPVPVIVDALENAYELSFGAVEPSGRRLLVAVDSSGSMSGGWSYVTSGGSPLGSAYEVANTMAAMLARIERANVHVIDHDTAVHRSRVTPRSSLRDIARWLPSGGGTDMSLAFSWALHKRLNVDGFVVLTDNETWAGRQHPAEALEMYRRAINPRARVIVVSMTATGHSIGDPQDDGVLNVAGLDGALPRLITGFIR